MGVSTLVYIMGDYGLKYKGKDTEWLINFRESFAKIYFREGRTKINQPRGVFPVNPMPTSYMSNFYHFSSNFVK